MAKRSVILIEHAFEYVGKPQFYMTCVIIAGRRSPTSHSALNKKTA
jgi:hypothetical protein